MDARWIVACACALVWTGALADREIYCEISSSNFAWGPQYGGTAIAPNGTVALFEYDFAKRPRDRDGLHGQHWLAPTQKELVKRFSPGRRVVGNLCPDRRAWLRDQLGVVRTAGQSKVADMQIRDGPTQDTHCFVFDKGRDRASHVLLQSSGATEHHNLSPSAPRLANWLSAVSAEARRRAELTAKDHGCIDDPPLTAPVYRDTFAEVRQRALEDLKATQRLHCQFVEDYGTNVDGEDRGDYPWHPNRWPARLSVVFSELNLTARRGRAEMFGDAHAVRIDVGAAGLVLTNVDAEKNNVSDVVTIVPYRIDGRELYPAVKHEIRVHGYGATATGHTGQCAPLPQSP